jgi:hypothetical protein
MGCHVGDNIVSHDRRVAEHLNPDGGRDAAGDPEAVLANPSVPQLPVRVYRLQALRGGVEDKGRVIGEAGKVVVARRGTPRSPRATSIRS